MSRQSELTTHRIHFPLVLSVKPDGVIMVVQNTDLIQLEGNATEADFVAYASAIDIAGLKTFN